MIYLYLFGTCFHFIYVFMIIGNNFNSLFTINGYSPFSSKGKNKNRLSSLILTESHTLQAWVRF